MIMNKYFKKTVLSTLKKKLNNSHLREEKLLIINGSFFQHLIYRKTEKIKIQIHFQKSLCVYY